MRCIVTFYLDFFSLMSPTWVVQDILVFILTGGLLFFLMKKQPERAPYLFLELVAFAVYASIYENMAVTRLHLYSYGTSLIMIGNVPLSIPLFEAMVAVSALEILGYMHVPAWARPVIVGFFAVLQDLSLDPVAVSQIYPVGDSFSGRWQWLVVKPGMASMFNEPVYNWSGWFLFTCFAATFILLGRWWFKRSNNHPVVGMVYPFAAIVGAFLLLVSPLSRFMLWLEPFFAQASTSEWVMLVVYLLFPAALLVFIWKGRMQRSMPLQETWPFFGILITLHASDVIFAIVGGYWHTLWIVLGASAIHTAILAVIYERGRRDALSTSRSSDSAVTAPAAFTSPLEGSAK
jgi:hypothetical protein